MEIMPDICGFFPMHLGQDLSVPIIRESEYSFPVSDLSHWTCQGALP